MVLGNLAKVCVLKNRVRNPEHAAVGQTVGIGLADDIKRGFGVIAQTGQPDNRRGGRAAETGLTMDENGKLVLAVGLRLIDFRKEFIVWNIYYTSCMITTLIFCNH